MKLENKVVVVTGASRGIGRAIAIAAAAEGARVIVNFRVNKEKADEVVALIGPEKAHAVQADVTREEDVRALVSETLLRFGKIDVLVNNAGAIIRPGDWKSDAMTWHKTLDVNLTGAWLMIRETVPYMQKRGKGAIVNIGSMTGINGAAAVLAYASAKAGIVGLTRSFAKELAPNIRVNAVLPSIVLTDMTAASGTGVAERFRTQTPLGRIAMPDEIAHPVIFLSSDDSSYITGETLCVDGGYALR